MAWSAGALVANLRDREKWARCADWLAILVAVELPWSTTGTVILLLLALLAGIGARDFKGWRDQALTPAGGLPVALWALAVIGMLWADAPLAERFDGMSSLTKLLAIPLLLAHFRRSERGVWVLIAFVASSAILLVLSWGLVLLPDLSWRGRDKWTPGIPVKDYIAQAQVFTLCVFGLCEGAVLAWRKGRRRLAAGLMLLALAFLANVLYVAPSRTALVTIPILLMLFGVLRFGWKGAAGVLMLTAALALAAWQTSPTLRHRVTMLQEEVRDFDPKGADTSTGERLEFWRSRSSSSPTRRFSVTAPARSASSSGARRWARPASRPRSPPIRTTRSSRSRSNSGSPARRCSSPCGSPICCCSGAGDRGRRSDSSSWFRTW